MRARDRVELRGWTLRESDSGKAKLFHIDEDDVDVWLPISQCDFLKSDDGTEKVMVPLWIYDSIWD